jgi:aldehyde:ferredoxin oxidoreductase
VINQNFGLTRDDDTLPKRYFDDPMPARITKGHHVDREAFEKMLDEYYAERGWNEDGQVSPERLIEIDQLLAHL